jgi:hypothetical protein
MTSGSPGGRVRGSATKAANAPSGVLQRAFAKGQLTTEEFERRVEVAYRAEIRHDLDPVLEDLPEYQAVRSDRLMKAFWLD